MHVDMGKTLTIGGIRPLNMEYCVSVISTVCVGNFIIFTIESLIFVMCIVTKYRKKIKKSEQNRI